MPIDRVLRSLRQSIPPGVVIGRRAGTGVGPAELLPLNEALSAQLDSLSNVQGSVLYRGAASWQGLLPGTSGQVFTTQGAGADPSWVDGGGSGWYFNPPLLSGLSTAITEGPGVSSIVESDDADVGLRMAAIFTQPDNALLRLTTLGTLPKTVTARTLMTANGFLNRGFGGICLRNSTTGQRIIWGTRTAQPGLWGSRQATGVAFDSEFTVTPHIQNMDALWVRIVIDAAGNGSLQVSADGKDFREYFSRTAAQMAGAGVDQVGLGLTYGDFGFADLAMSCQNFVVT